MYNCLPTCFEVFVAEFDNLFDLVVGRLFVMMHLEEDAVANELIALSLYATGHQTTEHSCLSIML